MRGEIERLIDGQRTLKDLLQQRLALVEGHRDKDLPAIDLADFVNGADIGVVERRRRPRLLDETLLGILVGREIRQQKLQHDRAIEIEVDGLVDRAHASLAELFGDLEVRNLTADHGGSAETPGRCGSVPTAVR